MQKSQPNNEERPKAGFFFTSLVLQVSPQSILKHDKVVLKSVSEPLPLSTRRNGRHSKLRKHFSEPVGLGDGTYRKQNAVSSSLFCC